MIRKVLHQNRGLPAACVTIILKSQFRIIQEIQNKIANILGSNEAIITTRIYKINNSEAKGREFQKAYCENLLMGFNAYYEKKKKYQARIKVLGKIVLLGYYKTFTEAVQARNVAMQCMWGEYGRYNDVPEAPQEIKEKVINKCRAFAEYSLNKVFLINGTI